MNVKVLTNKQDPSDAYFVRQKVFVEEQQVDVEQEIDEYDSEALHLVVYKGTAPIGAGRFRMVEDYGKAERICVLSSYRKDGVGKLLMDKLEEIAAEHEIEKIKLHAQAHAEGFYKKLGYVTVSGEFMDAGIPHVEMVKKLSKKH